jgi:hypothetical protein
MTFFGVTGVTTPLKRHRIDILVFTLGILATPIVLLSYFLAGYAGMYWLISFPVGLLIWGLNYAFIPAAAVLLIRALLLRAVSVATRIRLVAGVWLVVLVGWLGLNVEPLWVTMHGFEAYLRRRITAGEFQSAALHILKGETNTLQFVSFVSEFKDTNSIPVFAKDIFWGEPPREVHLSPARDGSPAHYTIEWGGHFIGLFGISAGTDNYTPDKSDWEEWIEWKPGVYVCWHFM